MLPRYLSSYYSKHIHLLFRISIEILKKNALFPFDFSKEISKKKKRKVEWQIVKNRHLKRLCIILEIQK